MAFGGAAAGLGGGMILNKIEGKTLLADDNIYAGLALGAGAGALAASGTLLAATRTTSSSAKQWAGYGLLPTAIGTTGGAMGGAIYNKAVDVLGLS